MTKQSLGTKFYSAIDSLYGEAIMVNFRQPSFNTRMNKDNLLFVRDRAGSVRRRREIRALAKKLEHHGAVTIHQYRELCSI